LQLRVKILHSALTSDAAVSTRIGFAGLSSFEMVRVPGIPEVTARLPKRRL
jgi:hypothetical protein